MKTLIVCSTCRKSVAAETWHEEGYTYFDAAGWSSVVVEARGHDGQPTMAAVCSKECGEEVLRAMGVMA